jgi:alpha-tubulin suppressor-like RCC1 family protein
VVQKSDGTVVVAGYNGFGQLGNNTTTNILTLTAVPAWQNSDNTLVLQNVAGGFGYVDSSGVNNTNLFMWFKGSTTDLLKGAGANNWGSLATGNTTDSRVPVTITIPGTGRFQEFGAIGGGPASCFVLRDTGRLYGWGYNDQGTLGLGDFTVKTTVQFITDGVTEMPLLQIPHPTSYEYQSTLYIKKTDGYYYACGRTYEGQAGTGTYLVGNSAVLTRMRLPPGTNIKFWGRNTQNNTRWNVFMVDENNRWWACGWTAGYAITNQVWATNNQVPSPIRVNPYNLLFNQF